MSDFAGGLEIGLSWDGWSWQVAIRSSRPLAAAKVFNGKPVAAVARHIPLLYSLCATAQSQAFAAAAEQALGLATAPSVERDRSILLQAELIKEHLWRLLLDWPPLLDRPPEQTRMAGLLKAYRQLRTSLHAERDPFTPGQHIARALSTDQEEPRQAFVRQAELCVLGMSADDWLSQCETIAGWHRWKRETPTPPAMLARALEHQRTDPLRQAATEFLLEPDLGMLDDALDRDPDGFVASPAIGERCHETTPLARTATHPLIQDLRSRHGNGLESRFAALLGECAHSLAGLRRAEQDAAAVRTLAAKSGTALAAVQAARGLLVHRVMTDGRGIERLQVLAPTEWNFHANGLLYRALSHLPPPHEVEQPSELERLIQLVVTAIDPCVGYSIALSER